MDVTFMINGQSTTFQVAPGDRLLDVLRREGYFGVKHGCEDGSCGACTVLVDGVPRTSCTLLAAQVDGAEIATVEGVAGITPTGYGPSQGWRGAIDLHPLQQAFVETGAIQCGYCTPAMILAAKALLEAEPSPTEAQVRDALSGILCRCTGYVKPVQAIMRAAALMRGEKVEPIELRGEPMPVFEPPPTRLRAASLVADSDDRGGGTLVKTTPLPTLVFA